MTLEGRVESAVNSAQAAQKLRTLVGDLGREGLTNFNIDELLERVLIQQRTRPEFRQEAEEAILDMLDALRGWCHTSAEVLSQKPVQ